MRLTEDSKVKMPCCGYTMNIEDFAELVQDSANDAEESGKLQVMCTECGPLVAVGLKQVQ